MEEQLKPLSAICTFPVLKTRYLLLISVPLAMIQLVQSPSANKLNNIIFPPAVAIVTILTAIVLRLFYLALLWMRSAKRIQISEKTLELIGETNMGELSEWVYEKSEVTVEIVDKRECNKWLKLDNMLVLRIINKNNENIKLYLVDKNNELEDIITKLLGLGDTNKVV